MKNIASLLIISFIFMVSVFSQNSNIYQYKRGNLEIFLLSEGQQEGKTSILIGATPEILQQCAPEGNYPSAVNTFLVRTPDKIILIDTGFGRNLFANLQSLGITPEQIDVLLLTHMHGDHIGGMLREDKTSFPNAHVYLSQEEYNYWKDTDNDKARKVIDVYKDQFKLFIPKEITEKLTSLLPGFSGIAAYGHTPGHTAYLLEADGEKLLIWADLTNAPAIQIPYPDVATVYDMNAAQAIETRKKILEYVSQNDIPVAGMHIAYPAIGNVKRISKGSYEFAPVRK